MGGSWTWDSLSGEMATPRPIPLPLFSPPHPLLPTPSLALYFGSPEKSIVDVLCIFE